MKLFNVNFMERDSFQPSFLPFFIFELDSKYCDAVCSLERMLPDRIVYIGKLQLPYRFNRKVATPRIVNARRGFLTENVFKKSLLEDGLDAHRTVYDGCYYLLSDDSPYILYRKLFAC
jgi:hypothetical protein